MSTDMDPLGGIQYQKSKKQLDFLHCFPWFFLVLSDSSKEIPALQSRMYGAADDCKGLMLLTPPNFIYRNTSFSKLK